MIRRNRGSCEQCELCAWATGDSVGKQVELPVHDAGSRTANAMCTVHDGIKRIASAVCMTPAVGLPMQCAVCMMASAEPSVQFEWHQQNHQCNVHDASMTANDISRISHLLRSAAGSAWSSHGYSVAAN